MIYKWWVFHPLICWRVHMWETKAKWVNLSGLGIAISPKTYQTCWCDISNPARIVVNWWFNVLFWKPQKKNNPTWRFRHGRYPLWLLQSPFSPAFSIVFPAFCWWSTSSAAAVSPRFETVPGHASTGHLALVGHRGKRRIVSGREAGSGVLLLLESVDIDTPHIICR